MIVSIILLKKIINDYYLLFFGGFQMKNNEGNFDRTLRIILALIIFVIGFYYKSWWGLIGLLPLITGIWGFCPLYALFKISTKKKK